jgi:ferric-dicitrate binding protein FerR (iron transport regulator)
MRIAAVVALVSVASWFIFEKGISKNQDRWTVYATTDEVKTLSLGDGSVVTLNRNSKLEVSPNFDNQRRTRLQGEAFFEVQKQEGKQFTVGLGQSDIMVLGTRFNASSSSGAERVVVEEGKVAFRLARANSDSLHLSANQSAGYVEKKLMRLPAPDPNEMAWRTQIINFSEQPMTYVEKTVEACYGKEIFVPDELATCKITAKFDQNSLEEVMEVIAIALNAEFKKSDNGWRLRGGSCD